jgi:hypothetical protein
MQSISTNVLRSRPELSTFLFITNDFNFENVFPKPDTDSAIPRGVVNGFVLSPWRLQRGREKINGRQQQQQQSK